MHPARPREPATRLGRVCGEGRGSVRSTSVEPSVVGPLSPRSVGSVLSSPSQVPSEGHCPLAEHCEWMRRWCRLLLETTHLLWLFRCHGLRSIARLSPLST